EGTVLSVDPAAGQKAKAATPIKVAVAQSYTVPDTTGMGIDDATALLEQEGFIVNVVTVYTDDSDEGTVLSSDPEAGTKLKSGSAVTVSVAKSRASELVAATQAYLDGLSVFQANNTSYELVGYSDISYIGSNTTTAAVTVVAYTTLPDGETVYGAQKAGTVTLAWSNDDTQPDTMSLQLS
ncbi:MAG: PASTA domain-containing protein, partial [Eggerthellaceae bacterium]|nr:PASTA domain-containing protein [Eggerthellaceae bacterium]